ncbi:AAA family ATPase [Microbacterium sp. GXF0217]
MDELNGEELERWVDGCDPRSGERRGRVLSSPDADLVLDSTLNAAKSFSIAALIHPDLAEAYEALQDRLRDRVLQLWQRELNARRGAGGRIRESLSRVEVVELQHRRSRALDPHVHRHLWLSVKVRGLDGKWSNVDSRVAMRMQTLVNAEGDLASRSDPVWAAALSAHGYSLNAEGEIAELTHVVRAVSRRSNQIEANRAMLLARWRTDHPGQTPGGEVLQQIDRYAWATHRPNKPDLVDEDAWAALVRDELHQLDPAIFTQQRPVPTAASGYGPVDRSLLARCALADADVRSRSNNGRFSILDVRAGATRAVASTGIRADRSRLQSLIDDVTVRALAQVRDLLPNELDKPQHVKAFVTGAFAERKQHLGALLTDLAARPSTFPDTDLPRKLAVRLGLGGAQAVAVGAVAGVERLVTVTGPAGTGKTTLLRAARDALAAQRRRMVVVAPTRKAAAVAGREVGVPSTSIHALLADYGWRWRTDDAGAAVWWRLHPGELDPRTRIRYSRPRGARLDASARVVVDEAGMLDLEAADALVQVALETGAGIALIGDPLQAAPVGHAGAMGLATARAGANVQLDEVHRFHDPEYAALTLQLRHPATMDAALDTAARLQTGGHVRAVPDLIAAQAELVNRYFTHHDRSRTVAIVTASNEDASHVNDAIQDERLTRGELALDRIAIGAEQQRLLEGDVVQTRRNDQTTGVENRAIWTITHIGPSTIGLQRLDDTADHRVVSRNYATEHMHLAYATTVHGIQGETTDAALVGPGVNAAGLYVGLTRGRQMNEAIVVAGSDGSARRRLAEEMMRGRPEVDLDDAARAAALDLSHAARDTQIIPGEPSNLSDHGARLRPGESIAGQVLGELTAWLQTARAALLRSESATANTDACTHGRHRLPGQPEPGSVLPPDVETALRQKIQGVEAAENHAYEQLLSAPAPEPSVQGWSTQYATTATTGRGMR